MIVYRLTLVFSLLGTLSSGALANVPDNDELGQQEIDQILGLLKLNPNSPLTWSFPELNKSFKLVSEGNLAKCYDNSLDDVTVDIFYQPLGEIVKKYFTHFRASVDLRDISSRTEILTANIRELAQMILDCALNTDPSYTPNKLGLTMFSYYTKDEIEKLFVNKGQLLDGQYPYPRCNISSDDRNIAAKMENFDWREKGVVSPIKWQAGCGSCFIFAANAAMESAYMIKTNKTNIRFSEQALIDCGKTHNDIIPHPCHGGIVGVVWDAAKVLGLAIEDKYRKYDGNVGECAKYDSVARPTDYCQYGTNDDIGFQAVVAKYGPASISIASWTKIFHNLKGPWTAPPEQCFTNTSHAVTIVGWDKQYWIIKNSWGTSWGVNGYLYLPRGIPNICGIYTRNASVSFI